MITPAIPCCSACWGSGRGYHPETYCYCPAGLALLVAAQRNSTAIQLEQPMDLEHTVWRTCAIALGACATLLGAIGMTAETWPISALILAAGVASLAAGVLIRRP